MPVAVASTAAVAGTAVAPAPVVRIVAERYDPARFTADHTPNDAGAVVTFTGLCRSEDGRLAALELEHYPGMAERTIASIAARAIERHSLAGLAVVHRHGLVPVGEPIVTVVAASRHRRAAFDGASMLMDFLKTDAPFWKKEHGIGGASGEWVDAREEDDRARERWG